MDARHYQELQGLRKYAAIMTGKNIPVVFGQKTATDGKSIFISPVPGDFNDEARVRYFGGVNHECDHITEGSDIERFMEVLSREKHGKILTRLVNIVEDVRVEVSKDRKMPKVALSRRPFYELTLKELEGDFKHTTRNNGLMSVLHVCGCMAIFNARLPQLGLKNTIKVQPDIQDIYDTYFKKFERRINKLTDYQSAEKLARDMYEALRKLVEDELKPPPPAKSSQPKPKEDKDDESKSEDDVPNESEEGSVSGTSKEGEEDDDSDSKSGPDSSSGSDKDDGGDGGSGAEKDSDQDTTGAKKSGSKGAEDDSDNEESSSDSSSGNGGDEDDDSSDEGGGGTGTSSKPAQEEEVDPELVDKAITKELPSADNVQSPHEIIQKKDERRFNLSDEYLKDPSVEDHIKPGHEGSDAEAQTVRARGLKLVGQAGADVCRLFIQQTKPRLVRRQPRGRFDIRRFEQTPYAEDLYAQKFPGTLERAALAIGLDNSASMHDDRKGRHAIASQLLSGLLYHLDASGIPSEVAGYTFKCYGSNGGNMRDFPIRIDVIKRYEERYDATVMRRCVPLPYCYRDGTPDMDVLTEYLMPNLLARPEKKKVLFMISDGEPTNLCGRMKESYKRYLQSLKDMGIAVWGFGIEANLSYYFKDSWTYVRGDTLADTFVSQLGKILLEERT